MFELARPFLLALAIGLLIGIERERANREEPGQDPLGSRTITVLALLGAVAAFVESTAIAVVIAAFAGAAIIAGYLRSPAREEEHDVSDEDRAPARIADDAPGHEARGESGDSGRREARPK